MKVKNDIENSDVTVFNFWGFHLVFLCLNVAGSVPNDQTKIYGEDANNLITATENEKKEKKNWLDFHDLHVKSIHSHLKKNGSIHPSIRFSYTA